MIDGAATWSCKSPLLPALILALTLAAAAPGQEAGSEMIRDGSAIAIAPGMPPPADSLHQVERLNGSVVTSVFARVIATRLDSVVPIEQVNGELVALSVVAASNGYLLSKASELEVFEPGKLRARIPGGRAVAVKMVQMQKENDLALLRVDATLAPIEWAASTALKPGFWVSAPSNSVGAVRVGIVGAPLRPIQREGGVIGVWLLNSRDRAPGNRGALVTKVFDGSGASEANIKSGDIIRRVAGKPVNSADDVTRAVSTFDVGETVEIVVERRVDGKARKRAIDVTLGYRREVDDKVDRNQVLSGASSNRRAGFENVIQHDIPLGPEAMGGPLFSIDGKAIGINIARRDRVTTYALSSEVARRVARDMIAIDAIDRAAAPARKNQGELEK